MAKIADIATGAVNELTVRTNKQRQVERMNMIREIKKGRKFVGTATDTAGVKFVSQGLSDARSFVNKDGVYEVWASYGFITCEYNMSMAEMRVGLAFEKFSEVNIIEREPQTDNEVSIFEVWGIL